MRKLLLGLFLVLPFLAMAQETEKKLEIVPNIHFRMFWMSTSYPTDFKNDFALGSSLNLGTQITFAERLKFRIGYRVFGNFWSSELTSPDPLSGLENRYEVGMFDLLNPEDKFFGKLERLSLSYSKDSWGVTLGRMDIETDWINGQDGRLSPTYVEGIHTWINPSPKWKIGLWGINRMSVRGSSKWLGIGESIGVFPVGRDVTGESSSYRNNTSSDWIGIMELAYQTEKTGKISLSETYVQNISNTLWGKIEKVWPNDNPANKWFSGIQIGYQVGVGNGGNDNPKLSYKNPSDQNWVLSGKLGYEVNNWNTSLSFTHLDGQGRWLSPREWGKDAWYTFIPRERNEGMESLDALVGYVEYKIPKTGLRPYLHIGFHWLPDLADAAANKYGFPSYRQINLGLKYKPVNRKDLDFHFILMNKEALGNEALSPRLRYNKVEMIHINGIVNWRPFQ